MAQEMRRSEDYYRKMCMKKDNEVPSQSEITERLGENISQILFDNCLPALRPFLGLSPFLDGPGPDLWISPSDLLIGKVKLKPPLTSKHIKALTHQGILDIGKDIEKKVEHEYDMLRMKALFEQEMMLKYQAKKDIRDAVAKVKDEMKVQHDALVEQLKQEFRDDLKAELAALKVKLDNEKQLAIVEGKKETEKEMQIKLEMAVRETVQKLTEIFAYELYKQSQKLHRHFWFHIKQEKHKLKQAVNDEKSKGEEKLLKLKAEFECENIANIMYMLATERRRCACEKKAQETNYLARINELEKNLEEQNEALQCAIDNYEATGREIKYREAILFQIIKQFQKFIYFALKAVPTQAEYLINVEKLMILEMTNSILEKKPQILSHINIINNADYPTASIRSLYQGSVDFSWRSENDLDASAHNYHECGNRASYASEAHSLSDDQDLPYFVFNEKIYLREDFRNMVSQGLKISKSHELWNFEVEKITEIVEPVVRISNDVQVEEEEEHEGRKTPANSIESRGSYIGASMIRKGTSNVRFSLATPEIIFPGNEEIIQSHTYDNDDIENKKAYVTPTPDLEEPLPVEERNLANKASKQTSSRLLFAKDSKTLLAEQIKRKSEVAGSQIKIDKVRDSLELQRKASRESRLSETVHLIRLCDSKLVQAADSKELIKNVGRSSGIMKARSTDPNNNMPVTLKNVGIQCNSSIDEKSVLISHIEYIPEDGKRKISEVNFHAQPNIIPFYDTFIEDAPKTIANKTTRPHVKAYPQSEFEVVGDYRGTAHLESQDEFAAKRVSSFIRIFRESPSLRHLFTEACSN